MDLLEFQAESLYFEQPLDPQVSDLLEKSADAYGEPEAEALLQQAEQLAPEHPMVLVALYRFYYYQHRLADALVIAERTLALSAASLDLPNDWRALSSELCDQAMARSATGLRFYLLALKGAAYLQLRLGEREQAIEKLQLLTQLDEQDRLGAAALLEVAQAAEYPSGLATEAEA